MEKELRDTLLNVADLYTKEEKVEKARQWLSAFMDRVNGQDNACTASPYLVCVQSLEFAYWADEEMHADLVEEHKQLEFEDENPGGFDHYQYVDQAWFFTKEGAEEHLSLNKHNYSVPRLYIKHCFRAPEMRLLLESIGTVVGKEYVKR